MSAHLTNDSRKGNRRDAGLADEARWGSNRRRAMTGGTMAEATTSGEPKLTERAARRIGLILKNEAPGSMLRVSVEGGGCSGFQYKFDFVDHKADDDLVLSRDGVIVLVDPVSVQY